MASTADQLQDRAQRFGLRLFAHLRTAPKDPAAIVVVRQCVRAGTGVGANYRATRRARSRAEFIARLAVVVEEADEAVYWLSQLRDARIGIGTELSWLMDEAQQLRAIFSRSLSSARQNRNV